MTIIGIDPGKSTGLAVINEGKIALLFTLSPAEMAGFIGCDARLVVFEDSRLQTVFQRKGVGRRGMLSIARSVGQIDLQCRAIEDLCKARGIECIGVSPQRKGAKLNAERFSRITGWTGRCSQNARDAAMVAWPYRRASIHHKGRT